MPLQEWMTPEITAPRARQIKHEQMHDLRCSTDRMFAWLMILQWACGIVAALVISPRTWIGTTESVHLHVWAAVVLGGLLTLFPVGLAYYRPGQTITRHVIAVAQMLWSALLIHLTGGRIETHFHVFGSLAFLAFYRDWRVLATATFVVATDHMVRGIWWPQSAFGVFTTSHFRWIEHAAWVAFEDFFLVLACFRGHREMNQIAERQAALEREIGERSRAEDLLAKAHDELKQFMYTVSHDLKSPLVTIKGFMGLLKNDLTLGLTEKAPRYTARIEDATDHMIASINDLLMLSRIGRVPVDPRPLAPAELVREIVAMHSPLIEQRGIRVSVDPMMPAIVADRKQMVHLFDNLIVNALKYGCDVPDPAIEIGYSPGDLEDRFFVRDHGVGIAPRHHEHIFGLFQRLQSSKDGTGVGLASVKRIVENMRGRVWVESELGRGATFWVAMPRTALQPTPLETEASFQGEEVVL